MPSNKAAWLPEAKARPFKVDDAPYPEPEADEVIIKNAAVAINPVDWKIQVSLADPYSLRNAKPFRMALLFYQSSLPS